MQARKARIFCPLHFFAQARILERWAPPLRYRRLAMAVTSLPLPTLPSPRDADREIGKRVAGLGRSFAGVFGYRRSALASLGVTVVGAFVVEPLQLGEEPHGPLQGV